MYRIVYNTISNPFNITINTLYLYFPLFIPSPETQALLLESNKKKYKISYGSWISNRKIVNDGLEFQVDICSAQNIDSPE